MKRNLRVKKSGTLFLLPAALLLITLYIASCSKKADTTGTSYIQFTNAAEAASPMDFYVSNKKENDASLTYNQSTNYFQVSSVSQSATIKSTASGSTLASITINPQTGAYYSVFYIDGSTVAYQDDLTAPQSGKAKVRFVNLNEGLTGTTDFSVSGGAKIASALSQFEASGYYQVDAATTFSANTTDDTTSLISIPTTIQAGHIYTIYLSGINAGTLKGTVILQK
jgi:hypothetical protein